MATEVLGQIDLNGTIVTADAPHTVKATAEFICEHGGEFVLPVRENRQALFEALDALPWDQVPVAHSATDRGHGRVTTRTNQVMPVGFQNSATGLDLGLYEARSYSLMRPPRAGRRLIRSVARSATGWSGRGGWSWRLRWGRRPL
jgi:hypothetical protein